MLSHTNRQANGFSDLSISEKVGSLLGKVKERNAEHSFIGSKDEQIVLAVELLREGIEGIFDDCKQKVFMPC
jgi:hypothetical protein